jgi:SAM-dependent methyltransferase
VYRPEGWLSIEDLAKLDGWSGAVAKLVANEFEIGGRYTGIVEQRGRGDDSQLRLRMPASLIEIGSLPEAVQRLFTHGQQPGALIEDRRPRPVADLEFALRVAQALRTACPGGPTLLVSPLYQGGHSSLVFGGLAIRRLDSTQGLPVAASVLVKVPIGLGAGNTLSLHDKTVDEARLLRELAGSPGLPPRVELYRVDLRPVREFLAGRSGQVAPSEPLELQVMVIPLEPPRTVEAAPRVLSSVIDDTAAPGRRLTRRNIHNILILAERLAALTRLLHMRGRAHRHLSVDAIVVRYELGIFEHILAADLAGSVAAQGGSDDLLYRDLFDLGNVLAHVITGRRPSEDRQGFQPPSFAGREQITAGLTGESETVARLLSAIIHYLLEPSPVSTGVEQPDDPTVRLLDHFLAEIEHINMLHWSKARGVPERQISFSVGTGQGLRSVPGSREPWPRNAADPVATRLVTLSNLVDVPTLARWCEHYITSHRWHASFATSRPGAALDSQRRPDGSLPPLSADSCIEILQEGFGRSAAFEIWRHLKEATEVPDKDAEKSMIRVLRSYVIHWIRENRFDVSFEPDAPGKNALRLELDQLRDRASRWVKADRLVDWIDELKRWTGDDEHPRPGVAAGPKGRLRSWMHAHVLLGRLRDKRVQPIEKEIRALEIALRGRSSPEAVFWHVLLARAWLAIAVRGAARPEVLRGESGWDKAMRTLVMAAGVAASRKLPYEMAATLHTSAYLTRVALSTPELCVELASQGADDDNVRIQAAECGLLAADAYQWLDNQERHCHSLLEAVRLLQASPHSERQLQAFQLLALARNNRLLAWQPVDVTDAALQEPSVDHRFIRYVPDPGVAAARFTAAEQTLFEDTLHRWTRARGRVTTSDDPSTVAEHGYVARYAPGYYHLLKADELHIELEPEHGTVIGKLFELARARYGVPAAPGGSRAVRVLDFGCGPGEEARQLARDGYQVWAVDSEVWFAAAKQAPAADDRTPPGAALTFVPEDPVEYARRIADDDLPPDGRDMDVVLFRCSLCRVSQRDKLLAAAWKVLKRGGVVLATDWIQTRTTDRLTWSRILDTMRLVDLETEPGYQRLCSDARFTEFTAWRWTDVAVQASSPDAPPMHRFFQRRLEQVRRALADERSDRRLSPYDRAFLHRAVRDLEVLTSASRPGGPLGWLFWGAMKPSTSDRPE